MMDLSFDLNGEPVKTKASVSTVLLDVIRGLGVTGTKEGCGVGVCGACTVLIGNLPVSSCIYLAPCAQGADVWTAEGLAQRDPALIDAFVAEEGMQCGICTPGQVVAAFALKLDHPGAEQEEIRTVMAGNLCRCTGYTTIVESVREYLATD